MKWNGRISDDGRRSGRKYGNCETYIYRATRSAGSNIGLVCAAAVIILIVAFVISFIQLKMTAKNGQV